MRGNLCVRGFGSRLTYSLPVTDNPVPGSPGDPSNNWERSDEIRQRTFPELSSVYLGVDN